MARIRQIKPVFFIDDDLALCSRDARFFFVGLWTLADREGRLEDRPARMKAQLFPYDADITPHEIEGFLDELSNGHFISRYIANGKRLIWIRSFDKHQHCHHREPDSQLPPPEELTTEPRTSPGQARGEPGASPGQEPDKHRSSPSASGVWVSASGYMDNGGWSVGVGSGDGGLGEGGKPPVSKSHQPTPATAFVLTDELRSWTEEKAPNVDPEIEAEKFRSHYGRDGRMFPDIEKAWYNWIFKAIEWQGRARAPAGRRESRAERNERICREIEAEDATRAISAKHGGFP
jgi:hypothetical protein